MRTYVLVSGFWFGGWCWHDVTERLRAAGHQVYPVTLTGVGERVHLASPAIDLETHVSDVVNVLQYEDLSDVILVGHSGGGVVVTGVADRVPTQLSRVVYLDSGPAPNGAALRDSYPPQAQELFDNLARERGQGWRIPLPPWDFFEQISSLEGLDEARRAMMRSRATDHPIKAFTQPLRLRNPARAAIPTTLITTTFSKASVEQMIASKHPWFAELDGGKTSIVELPTSHWPMFSAADRLADVLAQV